jgi:hypothetical protein
MGPSAAITVGTRLLSVAAPIEPSSDGRGSVQTGAAKIMSRTCRTIRSVAGCMVCPEPSDRGFDDLEIVRPRAGLVVGRPSRISAISDVTTSLHVAHACRHRLGDAFPGSGAVGRSSG